MSAPVCLYQSNEPLSPAERDAWVDQCCKECAKAGAGIVRVSHHPTLPNLTLVEAWRTQPLEMGEPRFAVAR